jgi:hypothetical protein
VMTVALLKDLRSDHPPERGVAALGD